MNRDHSSVGTCAWVLAAFLLVGGVAGRKRRRISDLRGWGTPGAGGVSPGAGDVLVQRGPKLIALLQQKANSEDWHERVFAEILIARIQRPQDVARCDETLGKLVEAQQVREAVNKYPEPEWGQAAVQRRRCPASHVVDVLWETAGGQGNLGQRSRPTAAAIQFYLSPESGRRRGGNRSSGRGPQPATPGTRGPLQARRGGDPADAASLTGDRTARGERST